MICDLKLITIKTFCCKKYAVERMKPQVTHWKKTFTNVYMIKKLYPKCLKHYFGKHTTQAKGSEQSLHQESYIDVK